MGQIAADGRLQGGRWDSVSAPGVGECDVQQSMSADGESAVPGREHPRLRRRRKWRPEQKTVSWLKDQVQKLSRPGDVVRDFCADTWSTTKVCMLFVQHRELWGAMLTLDC